jgi:hypothetical protein
LPGGDQHQEWKSETKFNLLFGLSQPLLVHGFNIETNYIHKRLIIDYSQGVALEFEGPALTPELRKQGVVVHMPSKLGIGVGYRITEWINLREEPKWHRFEFYYANEPQDKGNQITAYNEFTLGIGLYGCYQPFKKTEHFLKGIMIAPSIRYWPNVHSTLHDNQYTYLNKHTGTSEEIKTVRPGIELTALIIKVSIGYSFPIKKKG